MSSGTTGDTPAEQTFTLPDLGEGLTSAEVVEWLVAEGDEIAVDQPIAVLETVKVTTEVPSPWAGRVVRLCARPGERLTVGTGLLVLATDAAVGGAPVAPAHLVGTPSTAPARSARSMPPRPSTRVAASPAVRRLARKFGVDLRAVTGTGPHGAITSEDVGRAARESGDLT